MKVKMKTLKETRLDGKNVKANKIVEVDEYLVRSWEEQDIAERVKLKTPQKDGDKSELQTEIDNTSSTGTSDTGGSKDNSEDNE